MEYVGKRLGVIGELAAVKSHKDKFEVDLNA
jgi:hypothetical protein